MAELHVIGELESGSGWEREGGGGLFCRWWLEMGGGWRVVEGLAEGTTQTDETELEEVHFAHPLDVHLAARSLHGWPRLLLSVWGVDEWGRSEVRGYASAHLPSQPGAHRLALRAFRPQGSLREELLRRWVGGGPQLRSVSHALAATDRFRLRTAAAGTLHLNLSLVTRNFQHFGIHA